MKTSAYRKKTDYLATALSRAIGGSAAAIVS